MEDDQATRPAAALPLRVVLERLGWTPELLAARLNELAVRHGLSDRVHPKTPFRWRDLGQVPRKPWPDLAAALISDHLGRTIGPEDLGWPAAGARPVPADSGLRLPWSVAGGLHAARTVAESGDMRRRLFLYLIGGSLTTPAHEWLIAHLAGDTSRAHGRAMPVGVIDDLETITAGLRRMDDQLGGGQLLQLARQQLRTVIGLLQTRSYDDSTGKRLHATAGELLRLCGWLSFDSGQHAGAQRYWIAALHEAHAAGDEALGANVLGFMSCQAKDLGQNGDSITLAQTAASRLRGGSARVQAILSLRAAEAHASAGDLLPTQRLIDAAFEQLRAGEPQHGTPDWAYWLDETHAHGQAGYCYLRLGEWQQARHHLSSALRVQGSTPSREGALRQVLMARTYARQGTPDIGAATELGGQAVSILVDQVDSARVTGHIATLVNDLAAYRHTPDVRELTERIRSVLAPA